VVLDLPTGATIVCTFGGVLVVMFVIHMIAYRRAEGPELRGPKALVTAVQAETKED
jgi:hypothetical protein